MCQVLFKASTMGTLLATAAFVGTAQADPVTEFYKNKNIQMIVGFSAGGGYDTYARLLGRYMGKHILGNPAFVTQNMPGAGSIIATNHLYNVAPRDGTAMGTVGRGMATEPLFGNEAAKFDAIKFNWIGSANNEVSTCVAWHESGIETFQQVRERLLIVGATGPGADSQTFASVLNNVLGAKLEVVSGYGGGSDINLAMERGEVQGRCGWSWSSIVSTRPDWIQEKKIHVLIQMSTGKHPDLPHIPLVMDLAQTSDERQVLNLIFIRQTMGRSFVAPPGIPKERVQALQDAFWATMHDEGFSKAAKAAELEIEPVSGKEIQALVEELYKSPKNVVDAAAEAMN